MNRKPKAAVTLIKTVVFSCIMWFKINFIDLVKRLKKNKQTKKLHEVRFYLALIQSLTMATDECINPCFLKRVDEVYVFSDVGQLVVHVAA